MASSQIILPELLGLGHVHEPLFDLSPPPPPPLLFLFLPLPIFFPILLLHLITKYSPLTDVSDYVWQVAILSLIPELLGLGSVHEPLLDLPPLLLHALLLVEGSQVDDVHGVKQEPLLHLLVQLGIRVEAGRVVDLQKSYRNGSKTYMKTHVKPSLRDIEAR